MKPTTFLFVLLVSMIFFAVPIILNADCDMMAMIGIQNSNLSVVPSSDGEFNDPVDFFDFLRSRSGSQDAEIPLNNDGYGVIYYQRGSSIITHKQEFYKSGFDTWYTPRRDEPMDLAEIAITNPMNEATIVLGHDRLGTGGSGNHPFLFDWNGNTYTFMHNGSVDPLVCDAFMNYLGPTWFENHPSNWMGVYGNPRTFIDSELMFHFIMSKIILRDGNVVAGITDALNSNDVLGINFAYRVFNAETVMNFVLSDGKALYVFRNSPYRDSIHNLSYTVIDGKFIGIKTQRGLANILVNNQLVIFEQNGNISINMLDPTLPVELTSFTGTVSINGLVTLKWQTASETCMSGFNVFRGNTVIFEDAKKMNVEVISATNNAGGSNYEFIDNEIIPGQVLHYWLECVDYDGTISHMLNVTVTVPIQDNSDTSMLSPSSMLPNYPNPFRKGNSTNIPVQLRSNESGSLTIYNLKGQKVRDFTILPGTSNLVWDGRNSRGNFCAPGIYLTDFRTSDYSTSRKLVIVR